jgi:TonB family protein
MSKPKKQDQQSKSLRPRRGREKEFLRLPRYEGGNAALRAFIENNLHYPEQARSRGVEGDVHVKFDVAESGHVIEAHVVRGIGGGCDDEALRLVRSLRFKPVRNRGRHVIAHHDIILQFRLPVEHGSALQISYLFVPQSEPQSESASASESASTHSSDTVHADDAQTPLPLVQGAATVVYTWKPGS